jgi:hypothetical protein
VIADRYDLQDLAHVFRAINDLKGYWKLWSACLLQSASLPTPHGLILTRDYDSLDTDVRQFLRAIGARSGLIRHDRQREAPPYPRGGFLVSEARLLTTLRSFFSEGRIVAVYEPFNRLENGYNLNLLFRSPQEILVEIAGPGFDASNLQRGDVTPHEVLQIQTDAAGNIRGLTIAHRTTDEEYRQSVRDRITKFQELSKIRQSARRDRLLCANLLRTETYSAVPRSLLADSISAVYRARFIDQFFQLTGVSFPLNISVSYVDGGKRQIFWDATAPSLKFQGLDGLAVAKKKFAAI